MYQLKKLVKNTRVFLYGSDISNGDQRFNSSRLSDVVGVYLVTNFYLTGSGVGFDDVELENPFRDLRHILVVVSLKITVKILR